MHRIKQTVFTIVSMCVFLLAGCHSMERIAESKAMIVDEQPSVIPNATQDLVFPKEVEDIVSEPSEEYTNEIKQIPDAGVDDSLTVEGYVGVCEYRVDSWSLYDNWADAGISEEQLSASSYPVGDSGILLVTITQYCENRNEISLGREYMGVANFQPVAQSQIDGAKNSDDLQKYLYIETDIGRAPSYLDQPGPSEREYFYYFAPNAGESVTYTLGFVLSDTTRVAAENGTLLLWYTANGMPASADEMLLLPVK